MNPINDQIISEVHAARKYKYSEVELRMFSLLGVKDTEYREPVELYRSTALREFMMGANDKATKALRAACIFIFIEHHSTHRLSPDFDLFVNIHLS
jgi:hypothetical protein